MATTLRTKAYNLIRGKLLAGDLTPGNRVSELAMAKELGVSRAPIREAISQLVSEGLLEKYPDLGAFVTMPSRRELEELLALREVMECYAITKAIGRIRLDQLAKLKQYCDEIRDIAREIRSADDQQLPGLTRRLIAADMPFHMIILEAADNMQLMKIVNNFHILTDFFVHYTAKTMELRNIAHIWREHTRIFRALERGDAQDGQYWMKKQMQTSRRMVISCFDERTATRRIPSGAQISDSLRQELLREDRGA